MILKGMDLTQSGQAEGDNPGYSPEIAEYSIFPSHLCISISPSSRNPFPISAMSTAADDDPLFDFNFMDIPNSRQKGPGAKVKKVESTKKEYFNEDGSTGKYLSCEIR